MQAKSTGISGREGGEVDSCIQPRELRNRSSVSDWPEYFRRAGKEREKKVYCFFFLFLFFLLLSFSSEGDRAPDTHAFVASQLTRSDHSLSPRAQLLEKFDAGKFLPAKSLSFLLFTFIKCLQCISSTALCLLSSIFSASCLYFPW